MTTKPRFVCHLELQGPFKAISTTPPDSEFLASVVKGMDLRDLTIEGLHTDYLTIMARGNVAPMRLESSFRRHFTWGSVASGDEEHEQ